jgi:predicted nucleic acid-binding protein
MTNHLFDASSIMKLTKKHPHKASTLLEGEHILDLTKYEVGNAIWKIIKLIEKTDKTNALEAVTQAYHLMALMEVIKVEDVETLTGTMEIAFDKDLSFYDSAYLQSAKKHGLTLVTEDTRLHKKALDAGVTCIQIDDLKPEP